MRNASRFFSEDKTTKQYMTKLNDAIQHTTRLDTAKQGKTWQDKDRQNKAKTKQTLSVMPFS